MEKGPVFGLNIGELLTIYDRDSQSWKMSGCLFTGDYAKYSEALPKSGIMQNGKIYGQATWVPRIKGKESGSLPTPQASDGQQGAIMNKNTNIIFLKSGKPRKISNQGISGSVGLSRFVQIMWPTPTVNDAKNCTLPPSQKNRDSIAAQLLRTPDANMGKRGCKSKEGYEDSRQNGTHAINLNDQAQHEYGMRRLNPALPEWMMGYPENWTVIDCADSETRLSLK